MNYRNAVAMHLRMTSIWVCAAIVIAWPSPSRAQAPTLSIQSGVFAVNGQKKFLTFVSYFAYKRDDASKQRSLLQNAKAHGFDGVRVFPNWWRDNVGGPCGGAVHDPNPLLRGDGSLDLSVGNQLKLFLDIAYEEGMLVELALAHEPAPGITFQTFRAGIERLTAALRDASYSGPAGSQQGYRHVFLDLQNEYNVAGAGGCKVEFSAREMRLLRDAVKAVDDARLVTASMAADISPEEAWAQQRLTNADIVGYHDLRSADWSEQTDDRVRQLRAASKDARPIYFSEPYPQSRAPKSWQAEKWLQAARSAKQAGAAAWCFHTQAYFDWSTTAPLSDVEHQVVKQLRGSLDSVTWPR